MNNPENTSDPYIEPDFDKQNKIVELKEGVYYFLESGVHTGNGNPILEGEFTVVMPKQISEPPSSDQS